MLFIFNFIRPILNIFILHTVIWENTNAGHVGVRNESRKIGDIENDKLSTIYTDDLFRVNCSVPICDGELSEIYCTGPIIFASWYFGFHQSCPGSKLRYEAAVVRKNFADLPRPLNGSTFKEFCLDNFDEVAYLKPTKLPDWKENPSTFSAISNAKMKKLAAALHELWPRLTREFINDVHTSHFKYPVLPVPNRFVVPGGFFQVYFYWDTYWIMKGLLFCELRETALGILKNFAHIINSIGYIPNSGNIQLTKRSQPPLYLQMINDYFLTMGGSMADRRKFLQEFLPKVERELLWWRRNRLVLVRRDANEHRMFQYRASTNCPRPENFLGDYQIGMVVQYNYRRNQSDGRDAEFVWSSTASACESGLDFSARWFNGNAGNRSGMRTNFIVPVDLNVFMAQNYEIMSIFYGDVLEDRKKALEYSRLAEALRQAVDDVFFDPESSVWFDFDLKKAELRKSFYPSNIYPLLLNRNVERANCRRILQYLDLQGAFAYKGGVPTSNVHGNSTEQWDFPNSWAPVSHLFVSSLLRCESAVSDTRVKARHVADGFLRTVYNGLFTPLKGYPPQVWEKYDVRYDNGLSGFGGEYPVQTGFGWTNGVVLDFIRQFYTVGSRNTELSSQWTDDAGGGIPHERRKFSVGGGHDDDVLDVDVVNKGTKTVLLRFSEEHANDDGSELQLTQWMFVCALILAGLFLLVLLTQCGLWLRLDVASGLSTKHNEEGVQRLLSAEQLD